MVIKQENDAKSEDIVIELKGTMDESVTFPVVTMRLSQRLLIDCAQISYINSYGAQSWSRWMKSMDDRTQFVFRHIQRRTVDLFNTIKDFLPTHFVIESFYVPYECDNCDYEEQYLAMRGRDYIEAIGQKKMKVMLPPELNCQKCSGGMKISVWESKYFRFLEINNR